MGNGLYLPALGFFFVFVFCCSWGFLVVFLSVFPGKKEKTVDGVGGTEAVCHQELVSYMNKSY